jgi:hypothetical protein
VRATRNGSQTDFGAADIALFSVLQRLGNALQLLRESNDVCFWLLYVHHPTTLEGPLEGTEMSRRTGDRFKGNVLTLRRPNPSRPSLKRKQTAGIR